MLSAYTVYYSCVQSRIRQCAGCIVTAVQVVLQLCAVPHTAMCRMYCYCYTGRIAGAMQLLPQFRDFVSVLGAFERMAGNRRENRKLPV